jgi:hypothetical protein
MAVVSNLITTIKSTFRLFRQPHQIGDIIEMEDKFWLVLGIERFKLWGHDLTVWYTCQDLSQQDFVSMSKAYKEPRQRELEAKFKHDDDRIKLIELGKTYTIEGNCYKVTEWTEIKIIGTEIYISMSARHVYPIDRKEAKAKLFSDRRKKLKLEVL